MKIGLDLDGVVINLEEFQFKYGMKYFKKATNIDENGYDIEDIFHCTHKEREKFWIKYIWKYCKEPLVDEFVAQINALKENGNEIHIITGRAHTTEQNIMGKLFRKLLHNQLKNGNLKYDSINYCNEGNSAAEKMEICKKLKIDVMIDDKKENAIGISELCPVICPATKNNQGVVGNNIFRITTPRELTPIISNLDAKEPEIDKKVMPEYIEFTTDKYEKQYKVARAIGVPIFKTLLHPTIINKENIPKDGPLLLCGNHLHVYDQFPVCCATKRTTHWMSKKEYFDGKMGPFFKNTGAICVDRYGNPHLSKLEATNYLNIGSAVGLFPEGTRNHPKKDYIEALYQEAKDKFSQEEFFTKIYEQKPLLSHLQLLEQLYKEGRIDKTQFISSMMDIRNSINIMTNSQIISATENEESILLPFKYGAVSMAKETGATIVPFAVTGDYKIGNDNLTVNFGEGFKVENLELEEANQLLRAKILSLVNENIKK